MAIDLFAEDILTLAEAAALLPRRNGKKVSVSTLWRWSTRGLRGVKLETLVLGRRLTSRQALQRFAESVGRGGAVAARTNKRRQQDIAKAEKELREHGF